AFRRFEIPTSLVEKYHYAPLTRGEKEQIFGLNAARVFGIDVTAKRNEIPKDYLTRMKMAYLDEGAAPSHHWYGWVTGERAGRSGIESRRMPQRDSSAVVLGASMSGLLAARALSSHFARVTLVERDALPERDESRKGVPQSNHAHGLLASGYRAMDQYVPGMMDELEALGAPRGDVVGDFLWFQYGRWKLRHDSGLRGHHGQPAVSGGGDPPEGQDASQRDLSRRHRGREARVRHRDRPS